MGAPKNNEFWKLRSKHGRDKLFSTPELLWNIACEYFQWCEDNPITAQDNKGTKNVNEVNFKRPFTIKGFCIYCNASEHWFRSYKRALEEEKNQDFLYIIHKIEDIIYNQKLEGAIIGIYNANIVARELNLAENVNNTVTIPNLPDIIIK